MEKPLYRNDFYFNCEIKTCVKKIKTAKAQYKTGPTCQLVIDWNGNIKNFFALGKKHFSCIKNSLSKGKKAFENNSSLLVKRYQALVSSIRIKFLCLWSGCLVCWLVVSLSARNATNFQKVNKVSKEGHRGQEAKCL